MTFIFLFLGWCVLQSWKGFSASRCAPPQELRFQTLRAVPRSVSGFTEGLVYREGFLFESTGGYGTSRVNRIDPDSGEVEKLAELPARQFGEGLEFFDHRFYQLTWKEGSVLVWAQGGRLLGELHYPYEGWGIARQSNGNWVSSDGSSALRFFDSPPEQGSWTAVRDLRVMIGDREVSGLNELEYAQNAVWANLFQQNRILRIDPSSGCATGSLDLSPIVQASGVDIAENADSVLNGIAYRPDHDSFYVTGKNWPRIYEIRIGPSSTSRT